MRLLLSLVLIFVSIGTVLSVRAIDSSDYAPNLQEKELLNLINDYRTQNGLDPLVLSQTLGASAHHKSMEMAENNYFSHNMLDGSSAFDNMKAHGYTAYTYLGENIAAGNVDALGTFNQWKNSAGHNAIMLSSNYVVAGVGYAFNIGATYDHYWTLHVGGAFEDRLPVSTATTVAPTVSVQPTARVTSIPVLPTATGVPTRRPTVTVPTTTPKATATVKPRNPRARPTRVPRPRRGVSIPVATLQPTHIFLPNTGTGDSAELVISYIEFIP